MSELAEKPTAPAQAPKPSGTAFESVALVLQGGGALGAYQGGVYQALHEHNIEPTWIAGISIGAINSAIIAGNPPDQRVEKLRAFWELINCGPSWLGGLWPDLYGGLVRELTNQLAADGALVNGVPAFFTPRFPPPVLQPRGAPGATSWYDTAALRSTLEQLVDFDRINRREMRFSVGAVNVRTGNFAYFDNAQDKIGPEHVMASGALPPGFPAVEVDGEFYWDGGLVSNTPLDWVLSTPSDLDSLIWQVDLWSAQGAPPADLTEVGMRMKDIQYSSRTRAATDKFRHTQKLRQALNALMKQLPADLVDSPEARLLSKETSAAVYNIVQLIYRSPAYEGQSKDFAFSRQIMDEHWSAGYADAREALAHPQVLKPPTEPSAVRVFDFANRGREPSASAKPKRRAVKT